MWFSVVFQIFCVNNNIVKRQKHVKMDKELNIVNLP